MGKVNVFTERRASDAWQTSTFTEGEDAFIVRVRPLDDLELLAVSAFADELCARHITGGWRDAEGAFQANPELWLIDNEDGSPHKLSLSVRSMRILARLEYMQGIRRDVSDDRIPDTGYTVKELAWMTVTHPAAFNELWDWAESIQGSARKKAPAAKDGISYSQDSPAETDILNSGAA